MKKKWEAIHKVNVLRCNEEIWSIPMFEAARSIFSLGIPAENVNTWGSAYQNDRMIDPHIRNIKKKMMEM